MPRGSNPGVPNCDSALFPECFRTWVLLPRPLVKFLKVNNILWVSVFFLLSLLNLGTFVWLSDPGLTLVTMALSPSVLSYTNVVQIPFNLDLSSFDEASAHVWTFSPAKFQRSQKWELPSHMLCYTGFLNMNDNFTVFPSQLSKGSLSNSAPTSPYHPGQKS